MGKRRRTRRCCCRVKDGGKMRLNDAADCGFFRTYFSWRRRWILHLLPAIGFWRRVDAVPLPADAAPLATINSTTKTRTHTHSRGPTHTRTSGTCSDGGIFLLLLLLGIKLFPFQLEVVATFEKVFRTLEDCCCCCCCSLGHSNHGPWNLPPPPARSSKQKQTQNSSFLEKRREPFLLRNYPRNRRRRRNARTTELTRVVDGGGGGGGDDGTRNFLDSDFGVDSPEELQSKRDGELGTLGEHFFLREI